MTDSEMEDFLITTFCENDYERDEMIKWIRAKGIATVYEIIMDMFYLE